MNNFWQKLNKPIFALAPMADVTDPVFRRIIASIGKPDVMWTEFVSADGLALAPEKGRQKLLLDLKYSESERPIVAQFFTSNPKHMEKAGRLASELGFDGVDINMGCPVKRVLNQASCSALIKTPELAKEIILAAKEGAGNIPVSVKTRIGFNKVEIDTWIAHILRAEPAALAVHLRTVKEMSKVPAHWELMKDIIKIRDGMKSQTLILGNGDVSSLEDAKRRVEETGCDGVMIGRAIFKNPWLFAKYEPTLEESCESFIDHYTTFQEIFKGVKKLDRRVLKTYLNGFVK